MIKSLIYKGLSPKRPDLADGLRAVAVADALSFSARSVPWREENFTFRGTNLQSGIGIGSRALMALLLATAAAMPFEPARAEQAASAKPTMTVTARGEVSVVPDIIRVSIGVVAEARTAADAFEQNSRAVIALTDELSVAGVPKSDIATERMAIAPIYAARRSNSRGEVAAYRVTNTLAIRLQPIEKASWLVDRLVAKGANVVDSVVFEVSDEEAKRDLARAAAVKSARARAALLAEAADVQLGRILDIRESDSQPVPLYRQTMRPMAKETAAPIEPGETTLSASITLTYELEDQAEGQRN